MTIEQLQERLAGLGSPERARGERAYLKSSLDFYGVAAPQLKLVVREFHGQHKDLRAPELRNLVRQLWDTRWFELHALAVALLERYRSGLEAADMGLLEELLRRSHTWALVDFLSTRVAGPLVARLPETLAVLEGWAVDPDFWVRRASLLALLGELRQGKGEWELFVRWSAPMLTEREFFIRKAIGWVLREVSKRRPELVFTYLSEHRSQVSGLTLREGAKYLPGHLRSTLGLPPEGGRRVDPETLRTAKRC